MKNSDKTDYFAFLLRLWREETPGDWRASLENPLTGERKGFADLETLFTFLRARADQNSPQEEANEEN